ncbi:MAG TPA: carboxypeptidase-like regulatory domain-containing protein [Terriglobales bacterium]|nr:carboxypeptidase-like regulatory domain-containing protein [Terriglobales bacterium]
MQAVRIFSFILFSTVLLAAQADQAARKQASSLSISGTVLRADTHAPLPHVQISLNGGEGDSVVHFSASSEGGGESGDDALQMGASAGAMTDDKGHFTIANLKPGIYLVHASRAGLVQKNGGELGTGAIVRLQSGNSQNVTILMLAAGAITGRVLDEHAEPMQNASVQAMHYIYTLQGRHLFPVANATTDDKGGYRLFGLKPGSYFVMAAAGGDPVESLDGGPGPVDAQAGKKAEMTVYAPRFYPNASSPDRATPVAVRAGDEAEADFDLTRVPAHKISGKITGLTPQPSASSSKDSERHIRYVMAMQKGVATNSSRGTLREDSTFEVPAVTSGRYKVMAIDTDMKSINYGFSDVVVGSEDVSGIVISMNSGKANLNGVIRPDTDTKLDLSKLYVTFAPAEPESGSAESGDEMADLNFGSGAGGVAKVVSDGSFKGEVPPATGLVYAVVGARSGGFEDWYTSKVLLNGKDVTDSGFRVADAQRGRLEIIISQKGGAVEGTATDSAQKPFPNAQILAFPSDPKQRRRIDLLQRTVADAQGRFRLRGVRPGEYVIMALEDAQEQPFTEDDFLKQNASKIQALKVGQSTVQIQLQTITAEE